MKYELFDVHFLLQNVSDSFISVGVYYYVIEFHCNNIPQFLYPFSC